MQSEGELKVEIRAGDVIWCPPNERHWHGATSTTAMSHIAIREALDGKVVEWMEKVPDGTHLYFSRATPSGAFAEFSLSELDDQREKRLIH